jgi:hypothetical protein
MTDEQYRLYMRALNEARSLYRPGTDGQVVRYTVREGDGTQWSVCAEWPEDPNLCRQYCGPESGEPR